VVDIPSRWIDEFGNIVATGREAISKHVLPPSVKVHDYAVLTLAVRQSFKVSDTRLLVLSKDVAIRSTRKDYDESYICALRDGCFGISSKLSPTSSVSSTLPSRMRDSSQIQVMEERSFRFKLRLAPTMSARPVIPFQAYLKRWLAG
jgi:hypothetical protein